MPLKPWNADVSARERHRVNVLIALWRFVCAGEGDAGILSVVYDSCLQLVVVEPEVS